MNETGRTALSMELAELRERLAQKEAELKRLKALIGGAAGVMEKWNIRNRWGDIIAELREAAG